MVSTILPSDFARKSSHPNVMKFAGVLGGIEEGQLSTVSEWMMHGDIMKYIEKDYAHRLELVRDSTFPAAFSTAMYNSCTGQPNAWSTSIRLRFAHGGLKGVSVPPFLDRSLI